MKYSRNLTLSKLFLLLICLFLAVITFTGCGGTQGETKGERARRWGHIFRSNLGQINDDVDAILLMDRRSKLTDKLIRDY